VSCCLDDAVAAKADLERHRECAGVRFEDGVSRRNGLAHLIRAGVVTSSRPNSAARVEQLLLFYGRRPFFVVVGWTDPEGSRPWLGALPLAYYDPDGRLVYAGRAGTGINTAELERLWRRLQPLAIHKMPLEVPPPRTSRFGSPTYLHFAKDHLRRIAMRKR
jgi:hypothetical protein